MTRSGEVGGAVLRTLENTGPAQARRMMPSDDARDFCVMVGAARAREILWPLISVKTRHELLAFNGVLDPYSR